MTTLAWKQIGVAFVLGIGVALVGSHWCDRRHGGHCLSGGRFKGGPERFQERLLNEFSTRLKLTPDQRQRVADILDAKRVKIEALRTEFRPKFDEIRATTRAEIRQVLTPEQQQQFDVMDAEFESHRRQMRERWSEEKGKS